MKVVPFHMEHLARLDVQEAQRAEFERSAVASFGDAHTALVDGHPVACAGLLELWPGRAWAWALVGRDAGPHMLSITHAVREQLQRSPFRRIELAVDATFGNGCRWARALGFDLEARARAFMPDGRDAFLYSRVR